MVWVAAALGIYGVLVTLLLLNVIISSGGKIVELRTEICAIAKEMKEFGRKFDKLQQRWFKLLPAKAGEGMEEKLEKIREVLEINKEMVVEQGCFIAKMRSRFPYCYNIIRDEGEEGKGGKDAVSLRDDTSEKELDSRRPTPPDRKRSVEDPGRVNDAAESLRDDKVPTRTSADLSGQETGTPAEAGMTGRKR